MRNSKAIIIFISFLGIAGLMYFYFKDKNKKKLLESLPTTPEPVTPVTGVEDQLITATRGLSKLSAVKIKQYASWIDRIEQIFAAYRKATNDKYARPTAEAVANATALELLNKDDLQAVVSYWEAVRKKKVGTVLNMFIDSTKKISGLVTKLKNYKIIK